MDYNSGIRDVVYLAGHLTEYPAELVKPVRQFAGSHERLADSTLSSDYPIPYDDCEVRPRKLGYTLDWRRIAAVDKRTFAEVEASASAVDLCVWDPIAETFIADGVSSVFYLARRIAILVVSPLPTGAATRYATEVYQNDTLKTLTTHYTIGAATTLGRTPVTFVSLPAENDVITIHYVPLILAKHTGAEVGFQGPHAESRSFTFEEAA